MKKFFGFIKRNSKIMVTAMMVSMLAVFSSISSFALSEDISSSFSSALSTMQSDILQLVLLALPVGLGIVGVILAIKCGIKFVRGLIGKS